MERRRPLPRGLCGFDLQPVRELAVLPPRSSAPASSGSRTTGQSNFAPELVGTGELWSFARQGTHRHHGTGAGDCLQWLASRPDPGASTTTAAGTSADVTPARSRTAINAGRHDQRAERRRHPRREGRRSTSPARARRRSRSARARMSAGSRSTARAPRPSCCSPVPAFKLEVTKGAPASSAPPRA